MHFLLTKSFLISQRTGCSLVNSAVGAGFTRIPAIDPLKGP